MEQIEIPMPDEAQREKLFSLCMAGRPAERPLDYKSLAKRSEGLTSSDIAFVVNKAALAAAIAGVPITYTNLEASLMEICSERLNQNVIAGIAKEDTKIDSCGDIYHILKCRADVPHQQKSNGPICLPLRKERRD